MASGPRSSNVSASTFFTLATFALVFGILFVARAVILPVAMSVLLTALLAPLVRRVEQWRVPRILAVIVVVAAVSVAFLGVAGVIGRQTVDLAKELTNYRQQIRTKFEELRDKVISMQPEGNLRESIDMLKKMSEASTESPAEEAEEAIQGAAPPTPNVAAATNGNDGQELKPVPVRVVPEEASALNGAREWLGTIMEPLGVAAMVVVLTIFMLIAREDLRNRMLVLIGGDRVPGTTQLIEEAWQRVSRYLRMQLLINFMYGVAVFSLTLACGLPNAFLFGLQAMVFRFVPYLGPVIAAGLPLAVTVAVTPGWPTFIIVAVGLLVLELIVNNVLEPWLYGSSTGVSTVGILISAFFWTWLWGGVGLVLATPLTVCLVVLGKHVPALKFWATLLSEESPLGPIERLYQRLIARDTFESLRIIDEEKKNEHGAGVAATCTLLAGAVTRASVDHAVGDIDDERLQAFSTAFNVVWEEVADDFDLPTEVEVEAGAGSRALCLPARGVCDAHAARIVATFLTSEGWRAKAIESRMLVRDVAAQAKDGAVDVCVVSAIGERAAAHARYVCRQLTMQGWHGPIAVLVMPGEHLTAKELEQLAAVGATEVVKSHQELALKLSSLTERARLESQRVDALEEKVPAA